MSGPVMMEAPEGRNHSSLPGRSTRFDNLQIQESKKKKINVSSENNGCAEIILETLRNSLNIHSLICIRGGERPSPYYISHRARYT